MNKKLIISIIVILLLVIAIVLAVVSILNQRDTAIVDEISLPPVDDYQDNAINLPQQPEIQIDPRPAITIELSEEEKEKGFLSKTASAFAERFGSYSNQSNYENLTDLKYFMTIKMKKWVDDKVDSKDYSKSNDIYYGITTRAMKAEIKSLGSATAVINVKTQRQEFVGADMNSKVSYRDVLITFKKEGNVWKVDSAYWQ
jgi:hypothetical protein